MIIHLHYDMSSYLLRTAHILYATSCRAKCNNPNSALYYCKKKKQSLPYTLKKFQDQPCTYTKEAASEKTRTFIPKSYNIQIQLSKLTYESLNQAKATVSIY